MTAPFAEYELTSVPPFEIGCSMSVGQRFVLDPGFVTYVSRRIGEDPITLRGSEALYRGGWGGTRNHSVFWRDDAWWVEDLGHTSPARFNGERLRLAKVSTGDRVEPSTGLVFTFFVRDDLEPLADALAPQFEVLRASDAVLLDWVMERLGGDRGSATRVVTHFRHRLRHAGGL